jgi:bacterioferritin
LSEWPLWRIANRFAELRYQRVIDERFQVKKVSYNVSRTSRPPCGFRASLASTNDYSNLRSEVKGISAMQGYLPLGIGRILIDARRCPALIATQKIHTFIRFKSRRNSMAEPNTAATETEISRERLAELLNEDLSREYQAIISYVVYSQVLKGAEYMDIANQLEIHAKQELDHALTISRQIDYLGKMPSVTPKPVRTSEKAKDMLRFDLENENETIRNYRDRVRQCEALGEFAMAEQIRQILMQEQDHQIDLATALGEEVPNVNSGPQRRSQGKRR